MKNNNNNMKKNNITLSNILTTLTILILLHFSVTYSKAVTNSIYRQSIDQYNICRQVYDSNFCEKYIPEF